MICLMVSFCMIVNSKWCCMANSLQLYVHGEKFNQPIFHCNNISGFVEPVST